jgi:RNA polymerase sigma-70 factor (ECF subfamily)
MTLPSHIAPPAPATDADLVARIRAGDGDALSCAYYRHAGTLLTLAARLLHSGPDAQDVVQDLFVGLPEALENYQERGQLLAWLKTAVVRLGLMRLRAQRRRQETVLWPATLDASGVAGAAPDRLDMARAMARLPDAERAVVVLRALEGYSHDEIAELLGIRRNTAEVRFHRGLNRLRKLLEA